MKEDLKTAIQPEAMDELNQNKYPFTRKPKTLILV